MGKEIGGDREEREGEERDKEEGDREEREGEERDREERGREERDREERGREERGREESESRNKRSNIQPQCCLHSQFWTGLMTAFESQLHSTEQLSYLLPRVGTCEGEGKMSG